MRNGGSVSVPVSTRPLPKPLLLEPLQGVPSPWPYGQDRVPLRAQTAAPNKRGRSEDDSSANPNASDIHPGADHAHFRSKAAIKANHMVVAYRLPYRDNRSGNFLGLIWPSRRTARRFLNRSDSPLDGTGFEPSVPPNRRLRKCARPIATSAVLTRTRGLRRNEVSACSIPRSGWPAEALPAAVLS